MGVVLAQDKANADKSGGNNKARCNFCRKCYNSGLCMMPWPGFPVPGLKRISNDKVLNNAKI